MRSTFPRHIKATNGSQEVIFKIAWTFSNGNFATYITLEPFDNNRKAFININPEYEVIDDTARRWLGWTVEKYEEGGLKTNT